MSFTEQLRNFFDERIEIKPILFAKGDIEVSDCDLVICSSKVIYDKVKKLIDCDIRIISIRRAINFENIAEVINLKKGQDVLVVSNYYYTAMETINLLQELGIDHINYYPYYTGCQVSKPIGIAITPGAPHLVPENVNKVINLGIKLIDVSTIVEILLVLKLPLENSNFLTARYVQKMIYLNKYSSQLNIVLEGMLSTSHDGILAIDDKNTILFFNKKASELLNIPVVEALNKDVRSVLNKDDNLVEIIIDDQNFTNRMVFYNDRNILLNKEKIEQVHIFQGTIVSFKDVTEIQKQEYEIRRKLRNKGFVTKYGFNDIVGSSERLNRIVDIARKIAVNDLTVLIRGESGTGKELFAQAIHSESDRKDNPFIATNFASLSENLIESELFGYDDGAFTGARKGGKLGLFEQAHTGTIFIDEIGDASMAIQARLLRVLQEKEVMRVGGNSIIPVDVRVIVATNKDLDRLVREGKFRKDLYYRLKVLYFTVPPLRERAGDIYQLIDYFLHKKNSDKIIDDSVYELLLKHDWPGNVRELENLVNYIINVVDSQPVKVNNLPREFRNLYWSIGEERGIVEIHDSAVLEEYLYILKKLAEVKELNINMGRNSITEELKKKGLKMTVNIVRNRLKKMEEMGLVEIGKTRQGTVITGLGERFLEEYGW